jgi:hypothetical protein
MVEVEQGQELVAVWMTDADRRKAAACVAAQVIFAPSEADEREIARLWTVLHPDGEV